MLELWFRMWIDASAPVTLPAPRSVAPGRAA
jgi:hypothetical protein